MAVDSPHYPPSELKLSRLRREGIVPYSRDTLLIGVVGGVILGLAVAWLVFGAGYVDSVIQAYKTPLPVSPSPRQMTKITMDSFLSFARMGGIVIGLITACVLLVGLLQTRFLFTLQTIRFSFGSAGRERAAQVFGILKAISLIAVLALVLRFLVVEYLPRYFSQGDYFVPGPVETQLTVWFAPVLRYYVLSIFAIVIFVGIVGRFLAVIRFYQQHGMTRDELMQELRESEASPEVRQAVRQQFQREKIEQ